jgi:predicted DNA binding CopG/RHH family protein
MSTLDNEEQELLASFEAGEWQSVGEPNRLLELQSYAKAAIAKDRRITLRLSSADLAGIQTKAIEEGIPYLTFPVIFSIERSLDMPISQTPIFS